MNSLPSPSVSRLNSQPTHNKVALFVALLLNSCTLPPQPQEEIRQSLPAQELSFAPEEKTLEQHKQELMSDITEKIQNNPEFHSLQKIKNYLEEELGKRGLTGIASLQIAPFITDETGSHIYLIASVNTPQGAMVMEFTTPKKEEVLRALMGMLDNFEQLIQAQVMITCLEEVQRTKGILDKDCLEEKVDKSLKEMSHMFLQHGLKYEGAELKENNGELECEMKFFDIYNNEPKRAPLPTGIKIEEEPKRRGSRDGQTMIA